MKKEHYKWKKKFADENGNIWGSRGTLLKQIEHHTGYLVISCWENGRGKQVRAHRFVWECFYGEIPDGLVVNHKDLNKTGFRDLRPIDYVHKHKPSELDNYYWFKRFISGKLGLKYYLLNTINFPKHNFSIGAYICSNLGQADYSEISMGYTYIIH